jgi:hypothetical protein
MKRPISTAALILVALGVVGVAAALLTASRSADERPGRFVPSRELSEAVADPNATPATAYLE